MANTENVSLNLNEESEEEWPREENTCALCLDLLFEPTILDPCQHVFCQTCLRRLGNAHINNCPICRHEIQNCHPAMELHESLQDSYPEQYFNRQEIERNSNVYALPLPPTQTFFTNILELLQMQATVRFDMHLNIRFRLCEFLLAFAIIFMEILCAIRGFLQYEDSNWLRSIYILISICLVFIDFCLTAFNDQF